MTLAATTPTPQACARRTRADAWPIGQSLNRATWSPTVGSSPAKALAGNSDPVSSVDSWRWRYLIAIFVACALSYRMLTRLFLAGLPLINATRLRRPAQKCAGVRDRVRDSVRAQSLATAGVCGMCGIFLPCGRMRARAYGRRRACTCAHTYTAPHVPHIPHISGVPTLSGSSNPAPNPALPAPAFACAPCFQSSLNLRRIEAAGKMIRQATPLPGALASKDSMYSTNGAVITHLGGGERSGFLRIPVEHATGAAS